MEPEVCKDHRGYFFEAYQSANFRKHIGAVDFVQENESGSFQGVIRGLHYQLDPFAQAKLVRVIQGCVLDVAVDLRKGSPWFGKHIAIELSAENKRQLFIPKGFAHGFHVLGEQAVFTYKVDNPYCAEAAQAIRYNDPALGIDWKIPANSPPILSDKDLGAPDLAEGIFNFMYHL
jgi:dTDP-4-dehydrorhamnose 3,5-epimerase